jgi:hypothetical protein
LSAKKGQERFGFENEKQVMDSKDGLSAWSVGPLE